MNKDLNQRVEEAVRLFHEGYNCAQSVVAAFADLYGMERNLALRAASSFGGGIGRMRLTCGAACGLFMLVGLATGATDGADREGKSHNYALVQQMAEQFRAAAGSLTCAELLALRADAKHDDPQAAPRTEAYYRGRPCEYMVRLAATLFANYLTDHPAAVAAKAHDA